ncbi:MAG: hypothetical protein JSW37_14430 [Anaerolineales bacterium]|nr:MAG: hypothetical protein JSW37_14430 [Anaerolineales bacterium]
MIVEAIHTPVGKRDGLLRDYHPVELGALCLRELLARAYASLTLRPTPFHYGDFAVRWQMRAPMRGWVMAACVPLCGAAPATRQAGMQAAGILLVPCA